MTEHVFLVAVSVTTPEEISREAAEGWLHDHLPEPSFPLNEPVYVDSWWIAEDDRHDGSDNNSAVFVPKGRQALFEQKVRDYERSTAGLTFVSHEADRRQLRKHRD